MAMRADSALRACKHGGAVPSPAAHAAEQLEHARRWTTDEDPTVRAFAQTLAQVLERSRAQQAAEEEDYGACGPHWRGSAGYTTW